MFGRRSFSQNSLLNFGANAVLLAIALVCMPFIVQRLGEERLGLLLILWLMVGYMNMLDVGMGQTAMKFVVEAIGLNDRKTATGIVQTTILISLALGVLSGVIVFLASLTDILSVLNVSDSLRSEATSGLQLFALLPLTVLLQGTLKSVPIAFNRFDLVNGLLILNGLFQWGGTAVVLFAGGQFLDIVFLTVVARYFIVTLFMITSLKFLPEVRHFRFDQARFIAPRLLRFGGWISVSQVIIPFFPLFERFLISGLLSLSFVAFYSVPNDIVVRLLIIPMSLVTTLIPFLSGAWMRKEERQRLKLLYHRSIKLTYLLIVPLVVILVLLNKEIVAVWLGEEFAERSGLVLGILSVGALFNALAQLPSGSLQALGRPDIPSKALLIELLPYAVLCYYLTMNFGIAGTAIAWSLRVIIDSTVLIFFASREMREVVGIFDYSFIWKAFTFLLPGSVAILLLKSGTEHVFLWAGGAVLALILYTHFTWLFALDQGERGILLAKIRIQSPEE